MSHNYFRVYGFSLLLALSLLSCQNSTTSASTQSQLNSEENTAENNAKDPSAKFGIVIHGGAGTITRENMSDSLQKVYEAKLTEAVSAGHQVLENGGTAIEAVQTSIIIMEDSPLFNSAKGAVFTNEGKNSLDASIMDGKTLNAGAIAGVETVKNPIKLAYQVMENSPHVLLSGKGAETFAAQQGLEIVDPSYFFTQNRYDALLRVKNKTASAFIDSFLNDTKFGTVGCVALDKNGNIAGGTSTGGMTNKKWGRIGDSPIIGAGTYANNKTCAISATGWGEYFMRGVVAYDISARMEYANESLQEASQKVIQEKLPELGGNGGIIGIDAEGNTVMAFNTPGMYRASMNAKGELEVKMYKD